MKNLFRFFLVALFIVGLVYSAEAVTNDYASQNVEILGASGGALGTTPPTVIMKVRYSRMDATPQSSGSVISGDVLIWDTNSADGITVSRCVVDSPNDTVYFAGVAVTDILSADSTSTIAVTRNWGYMAVKGYCLAKVDTSESATGEKLTLGGATLVGAFQTVTTGTPAAATTVSQDIGQLLTDTTVDGLMPVWLR